MEAGPACSAITPRYDKKEGRIMALGPAYVFRAGLHPAHPRSTYN